MKKKFLSLVCVGITLIACGKQREVPKDKVTPRFRVIDQIQEGSFSLEEKNLGSQFCAALAFKRTNFYNLYGATPKNFSFSMSSKGCEGDQPSDFGQTLVYSSVGGLSYAVPNAGGGTVPSLDTDSSGVFATYCALQAQNSRVYVNGAEMKVYHFAVGTLCGGSSSDICGVYERAPVANPSTTNYKLVRLNTGTLFGKDLRGQEVFVNEQVACAGQDFQLFSYKLDSVQN